VVVTAATHTVPLADAISEADYKRERCDANEQFHSRQRIGTALFPIKTCRDFYGTISRNNVPKKSAPLCSDAAQIRGPACGRDGIVAAVIHLRFTSNSGHSYRDRHVRFVPEGTLELLF
jgi:hypothetical protein